MNYFKQYKHNNIETASPERILIMLYDGALRFIRQARQGMKDQELKPKLEGISRSIDILNELSNTLDFDKGGEVASNLQRIYDFMVFHLGNANLQKKIEPVKEVHDMMVELREAWESAADQEPAEARSQRVM